MFDYEANETFALFNRALRSVAWLHESRDSIRVNAGLGEANQLYQTHEKAVEGRICFALKSHQ